MRVAVAAALVLAASAALADSWVAFGRRRTPDSAGEYYVVIDGTYSSGTFVYARRAKGTPPVTAEEDLNASDARTGAQVRKGDAVLARGTLSQLPLLVHVSNRGNGFVCVEKYANVGYGNSVVIVSEKGVVRHELKLSDLFDASTIEGFRASVSSIWWHSASWIDEEEQAVVLNSGELLRVVSMQDGAVREGTHDDVRRGVEHDDAATVNAAIEIATRLDIGGLEKTYAAIVLDERRPLGSRLRAGAALGAPHDTVKELFRRAAERPLRDGVTKDEHGFALERLGDVLGADALPLLREALRSPEGWHKAQVGLARMGAPAVPTLIAILGDSGTSDYRGGAAHALRQMDPSAARAALSTLLDTVSDPDDYVANAAVNAAVAIDEEGIAGRLVMILAAGSTQDSRIASYFQRVRHPDAIAALEKALPRHDADSYDARAITRAIAFQRGR